MDDVKVEQWLEREDRRIIQNIRTHGCSLQHVFPRESDEVPTPFCYTIGLFGLGHPELLVFGLDFSSAAGLLNHLHALIAQGRDLVPGELLAFEGHDETYLVEEVPNPGEILFAANRHYVRPSEFSVPALQLTWSVNGAFPWDEGYPYQPESQPRPGDFSAVVDRTHHDGPCGCC